MDELVYLDTARLGRIRPATRSAHQDFAEFSGEAGGAILLDDILRFGFDSAPDVVQERYPGLRGWQGLTPLKRSLQSLLHCSYDSPILVANRSAQLMKLAARLLFNTCQNVLITDLGWDGYHAILKRESKRTRRRVTYVRLHDRIMSGKYNEDACIQRLKEKCLRHRCDGLFLTAVSSRGISLPIERIVRELEAVTEIRFVVVDGAQDFCHLGLDLRTECCDFYLAGCHKWLASLLPMGVAAFGNRRSVGAIETIMEKMRSRGELDDPLLHFTQGVESGRCEPYGETVNIAPLFVAQAAMDATLQTLGVPSQAMPTRERNTVFVSNLASELGWRPFVPHHAFRSGILLLKAKKKAIRMLDPLALRQAAFRSGVVLSSYPGGMLRLSMPETVLSLEELQILEKALHMLGRPCGNFATTTSQSFF